MGTTLRGLAGAVLGLAALSTGTSGIAAEEVSFAGKTINVIIGTTPGGGTDGTTRLLGRYLEKQLPGNPRMVYRNMPGGGGIKATSYFAHAVPTDGTVWMGGGTGYVHHQTLRLSEVDYDPRTFHYFGGVSRGGSIMILRKSKVDNLRDSSKKSEPAILGVTDGIGTYEGLVIWAADILHWNFRFVIGYPGTSALVLAARRGETDGFGTSNVFQLRSLLNTGEFAPVAQIGQYQEGKVNARSSFPDVPTLDSIAEGKLSGVARDAFEFWYLSTQVDKWYALPPKTPAAVVATYRAAFERVFKNPEFVKYGKSQFSEDFSKQTGQDLQDIVDRSSYPNAAIKDYSLKLRKKYGLPIKPLTEAELKALAKKLVKMQTVTSALLDIKRGGRILSFKAGDETHKVRVSGSRTKVSIGGKATKRKNLKVGMTCKIAYPADGGEAQSVACN